MCVLERARACVPASDSRSVKHPSHRHPLMKLIQEDVSHLKRQNVAVLPATLWLPRCPAWITAIRHSGWVCDAAPRIWFISAEGRRTIAMSSVTPLQRTRWGDCCTRLCTLGAFPLAAGCCSGFSRRGVHGLIHDLVESTAKREGEGCRLPITIWIWSEFQRVPLQWSLFANYAIS